MSAVQICALGIIAVFAVILMRDSGAPHPESIVIILAIIVFFRVTDSISDIVGFIFSISEGTGVSDYVKLLVKAAGIAYIVDFAAGLCRDAGEGGVAAYVEMAGRCEIVLLTLPIARELLEISFGMLNL
ncbi:MAG: hypothetical protein IKM46_01930 [Clostridia bacterium]|nr:hypothetical protein [Clostridia bacterium]